jgi:hypothetical protein
VVVRDMPSKWMHLIEIINAEKLLCRAFLVQLLPRALPRAICRQSDANGVPLTI